MTKLPFRRWVKTFHLYLAILSSLPLIIVSNTGALLVYHEPLDRWINKDWMEVRPQGKPQSIDQLYADLRLRLPNEKINGLTYPADNASSVVFTLENGGYGTSVFVDPYTAEIKGRRSFEEWSWRNAVWVLFAIHYDLKAGNIGAKIVGISALILMGSILTGLFLWLPKTIRSLRFKLRLRWAKSWKQTAYTWHANLGFYFSSALVFITLSGASITFYQTAVDLTNWMTRSAPIPQVAPIPRRTDLIALSPDKILERARAHIAATYNAYPTPETLDLGSEENAAVSLRLQGEPGLYRVDRYSISLNPYTGEVLSEENPHIHNRSQKIIAWVIPVHFGTWGDYFHPIIGMITRFLWVFAALIPFFLIVSRFTFWKKPKWLKTSKHKEFNAIHSTDTPK